MKVMERSTTRNASFRSDPLGIVGANTTLTRACSIALGRLAPGSLMLVLLIAVAVVR
jgi:Uncharacterized ACR, COG1993